MPKIQRLNRDENIELAIHNDLRFPKTDVGADYDSRWSTSSTTKDLYKIIATWESAVLFAAREGWVHSTAPVCLRPLCRDRQKPGYLYKRKHCNWVWRFSCCATMVTILKDSMFYNNTYSPGKLLELMSMTSMRVPVTTISRSIFGCLSSEVYAWSRFFREVAGYKEDHDPIQLGGHNKVVEGDGMFVLATRKGGVGRWHSKEHIYAVVERGSRKIRRKVVKDKSATVLSVFDKHILQGTIFMCDPGKENQHFKTLSSIANVYEIPGPIHVDLGNRYKNTQTVEGSHAEPKMRLRLGRGLRRHNLQTVMDLEDFIRNRTDGTPQDINI